MPDTHLRKKIEIFVNQQINIFIKKNNIKDNAQLYNFKFDKKRYQETLFCLCDLIKRDDKILEIGNKNYLSSNITQKYFSKNNFTNTNFELRHGNYPLKDNYYDLIIATEVIEHICDDPYQEATTFSGVKNMLLEFNRILKPNGKLFITTPNATGIWLIQRLLLHEIPWFYDYHFRELSINELSKLLFSAGFKIQDISTKQVWHFWNYEPIYEFMKNNNYSIENRGDDIFCIATKKI